MVYGAAVAPPQRGFEQNVGQYNSDVLFALDDRIFYQNRVQLTYTLAVRFGDANPSAAAVGKNPVAFPLNLYLLPYPEWWRENVPHFSTVRYAQIYPGIDADWNCGTGLPMLRIVVAPGGNPHQLLLRLQAVQELHWRVSGDSIDVWWPGSLTLAELIAYQPAGTSKSKVAVRFVQVDESSFRPTVGTYDAALPLVIEFGRAPSGALRASALRPGHDDTAVLAGGPSAVGPPYYHGFLAKVSRSGNPAFLSLFDGIDPTWLVPGRDGDITVAGTVGRFLGLPPATPGAPRPVGRRDGQEGWVGRFDGSGKLRAGTFTGDAIGALAVDPQGSVYFATGDSVVKWVPGNAQFSFTTPVRSVSSLSTNSSGSLAFAAARTEGQPTTSGAYKTRHEGPWDLYVGMLDQLSGRIQMATYVPIVGRTTSSFTSRSSVALAPGGSLWIASAFQFDGGGDAYTLVALSADGSRVFHSESVPAFPEVSFDSRGNVLAAVSTYWPNLPTVPDAPRRAACQADLNLHLRTMAPDGSWLNGTYLPGAGRIVAFDGPDRLFVDSSLNLNEDLERVDTSRPANPGIACVIHTASRERRTVVAPGGLSTLVGNQLGPLEQANASFDGSGSLPLTLAGVQVLINQVPAPLVSVQQGLVTFYTPEDTARGSAQVEVRLRGAPVASTVLSIADAFDFAVLAADGSGRGLAAALNQDGTVNGPNNPARWASVVAVFGTGPLPASVPVFVGGVRATVEYAGPAPGAVPGVKEINFRLPSYGDLPPGWLLLWAAARSYGQPPIIIYVTP